MKIDRSGVPAKVTIANNNEYSVNIPFHKTYGCVEIKSGDELVILVDSSESLIYYQDEVAKITGLVVTVESAADTTSVGL